MRLKIGDFGLATEVLKMGIKKYTVCGSPAYMAPETLLKQGVDYKVDLWSLGVIFY